MKNKSEWWKKRDREKGNAIQWSNPDKVSMNNSSMRWMQVRHYWGAQNRAGARSDLCSDSLPDVRETNVGANTEADSRKRWDEEGRGGKRKEEGRRDWIFMWFTRNTQQECQTLEYGLWRQKTVKGGSKVWVWTTRIMEHINHAVTLRRGRGTEYGFSKKKHDGTFT